MIEHYIQEQKRYKNLGALAALKKARMHGTKLVVVRDGKLVHETPDEFEKYIKENSTK